jgi:hypothetical protein
LDKWGFSALRATAIDAISPLASPVDKIVLGRKYGLDEWVFSAFEELLVREAHITEEEGDRIGMKMMVTLAAGRMDARCVNGIKLKPVLRALTPTLTARLKATSPSTGATGANTDWTKTQSVVISWLYMTHDTCHQTEYQTRIIRHLLRNPLEAPANVAALMVSTLTSESLMWFSIYRRDHRINNA